MKIRNNIALLGWSISTIFLVLCGLFTYILLRDGAGNIQINPPDNTNVYDQLFISLLMGGFWLAGIGAAIYEWDKPCVQVEVRPDGMVVITRRYPFRKNRRILPSSMLHAAEVRETGADYFKCLLTSTDGITVTIAEGKVRERCELACERFNTAIGKHDAEGTFKGPTLKEAKAMSMPSVEQQINNLRPVVMSGLALNFHKWMVASAIALVILSYFLRNPIPLMIALFCGVVGLSGRRTGPNLFAAVLAYDTATPTTGLVSITITCGENNHYHALVQEHGQPDWKYEFVPQGWEPTAGIHAVRIWRTGSDGPPALTAVDAGILIPRNNPEQKRVDL